MSKTINLRKYTEDKIQKMEKQVQDYGTCIAQRTDSGPVRIKITQNLINEVLAKVRGQGGAEKRWDINKREGEIAENTLADLMQSDGTTVEVKRDFKISDTGNLAIEFMCGGNPSGISTSQAEWWAYMLDGEYYNGEVIILIRKKRLERLLLPARVVRGGDHNKAEMYLLHAEELVKGLKGVS